MTAFGNGCKVNYIQGNFEPFKEELAPVRLFKLQLLDTLLSSFLVLVHYSGALAREARSGAPWVKKCGKLPIRENLVIT